MRVKESERDDLKLTIFKTKIIASSPINSWQIEGENVEVVTNYLCLGSKSLWIVTAAMKLDDSFLVARKVCGDGGGGIGVSERKEEKTE